MAVDIEKLAIEMRQFMDVAKAHIERAELMFGKYDQHMTASETKPEVKADKGTDDPEPKPVLVDEHHDDDKVKTADPSTDWANRA